MQKEEVPNNRIRLVRLSEEHTVAFKEEMQDAFQHGFEAYNKDGEETNQWQVLPEAVPGRVERHSQDYR